MFSRMDLEMAAVLDQHSNIYLDVTLMARMDGALPEGYAERIATNEETLAMFALAAEGDPGALLSTPLSRFSASSR
jgi:hypothetical protein